MPELDFMGALGIDGVSFGASRLATIGIVLFISLIVIVLAGLAVWWIVRKRIYRFHVHVFRDVGNNPTRVGTFRARSIPVGRAGDQLWYVAGVKKYLPVPNIQSAPNEYWFWIREDGEWINFGMGDLDEAQKEAGVKYIHQDMRMQRLATDRLLEQRLMMKSFWEKWGTTIMTVIFFLVIAVSLTIFMYMYGKNIDKMNVLTDKIITGLDKTGDGGDTGKLVPVELLFFIPVRLFNRLRRRFTWREWASLN